MAGDEHTQDPAASTPAVEATEDNYIDPDQAIRELEQETSKAGASLNILSDQAAAKPAAPASQTAKPDDEHELSFDLSKYRSATSGPITPTPTEYVDTKNTWHQAKAEKVEEGKDTKAKAVYTLEDAVKFAKKQGYRDDASRPLDTVKILHDAIEEEVINADEEVAKETPAVAPVVTQTPPAPAPATQAAPEVKPEPAPAPATEPRKLTVTSEEKKTPQPEATSPAAPAAKTSGDDIHARLSQPHVSTRVAQTTAPSQEKAPAVKVANSESKPEALKASLSDVIKAAGVAVPENLPVKKEIKPEVVDTKKPANENQAADEKQPVSLESSAKTEAKAEAKPAPKAPTPEKSPSTPSAAHNPEEAALLERVESLIKSNKLSGMIDARTYNYVVERSPKAKDEILHSLVNHVKLLEEETDLEDKLSTIQQRLEKTARDAQNSVREIENQERLDDLKQALKDFKVEGINDAALTERYAELKTLLNEAPIITLPDGTKIDRALKQHYFETFDRHWQDESVALPDDLGIGLVSVFKTLSSAHFAETAKVKAVASASALEGAGGLLEVVENTVKQVARSNGKTMTGADISYTIKEVAEAVEGRYASLSDMPDKQRLILRYREQEFVTVPFEYGIHDKLRELLVADLTKKFKAEFGRTPEAKPAPQEEVKPALPKTEASTPSQVEKAAPAPSPKPAAPTTDQLEAKRKADEEQRAEAAARQAALEAEIKAKAEREAKRERALDRFMAESAKMNPDAATQTSSTSAGATGVPEEDEDFFSSPFTKDTFSPAATVKPDETRIPDAAETPVTPPPSTAPEPEPTATPADTSSRRLVYDPEQGFIYQ